MAQVKCKTLVLEQSAGMDYLENPQLTALLGSGWQIASCKPNPGDTRLQVKLIRSVEIRPGIPGPEDGIIWQGRPPFPGTLKQMRNNASEQLRNSGSIS